MTLITYSSFETTADEFKPFMKMFMTVAAGILLHPNHNSQPGISQHMTSRMDVSDINWLANPKFEVIDDILVKDVIILKGENGWMYRFKCSCNVADSESNTVRVHIDAVFDWDTKSQIVNGKINDLIGMTISLPAECIHEVYPHSR